MKKYKIIDKDFDGLTLYHNKEDPYWNVRLYNCYANHLNRDTWHMDISRYFIGWFPISFPFGLREQPVLNQRFCTKIIKIK